MNVPLGHVRTTASASMESTATPVNAVHRLQGNTVQRSSLPALLIHVKKAGSVVLPQTTHLTSVAVQLDGRDLAVMRMSMNAKRIHAKTMVDASTIPAATHVNVNPATADTPVKLT